MFWALFYSDLLRALRSGLQRISSANDQLSAFIASLSPAEREKLMVFGKLKATGTPSRNCCASSRP